MAENMRVQHQKGFAAGFKDFIRRTGIWYSAVFFSQIALLINGYATRNSHCHNAVFFGGVFAEAFWLTRKFSYI